jgi:hypothetical protein
VEKQTKTIALLSAVLILMPLFINNSYGLIPFPSSDPSLPEISLQLELRNSEGQLILYIEPTTLYLNDVPGIHNLLDTMQDNTTTIKDGKKYETFYFKQEFYFDNQYNGQITTNELYYNGSSVLTVRYDGFIAQPGEVLHADWKIVRIVQ